MNSSNPQTLQTLQTLQTFMPFKFISQIPLNPQRGTRNIEHGTLQSSSNLFRRILITHNAEHGTQNTERSVTLHTIPSGSCLFKNG
jgi:hypothetical protein